MGYFSTILFLLLSHWSGISKCGIYQVSGVARSTPKGHVIVVNEKSQSEFTITVSIPDEAKLAPYVNKAVLATVALDKKSSQGVIKEIGPRIPNPLSPKDSGVKMLSEAKCQE